MQPRLAITFSLACVLPLFRVFGQAAPYPGTSYPIVASDPGSRMQQVADGVYSIIHGRATEFNPHGNTGIVVGDNAVLVVDSDFLPSRTDADIALIRKVTDKPVRYLVNTHWHGDHTHGNGVYRDAFPGLTIIGSPQNRELIELNLVQVPAEIARPHSFVREALADEERKLARGKDSTGRSFTPEELRDLTRSVAELRQEFIDLPRIAVVPPNLLFSDSIVMEMGLNHRVVIRNQGRANSPSDVTVYLPHQRVLFTGDILVFPRPFVGGSYPAPWIDVLRRLEGLQVSAVVPGHGPVLPNHNYTRTVREVFEITRQRIDSAYRAGTSLDEIQRDSTLVDDLRTRFDRPEGNPFTPSFWRSWVVNGLIERMSQCVQGYRC
jgi:glyoxylase-like metal-dependent hydrolase (beta-lactamase superfamily II)